MGVFFDDPLYEEFSNLLLGLAPYGAGTLGEVQATAALIKDGDDDSWHVAWRDLADRLVAEGDASAAGGHRVSAREAYLRATFYYSASYHPLFGAPVDPRLLKAFQSQGSAFDKAAALLEPAGERLEIDFEGARLPAYLFRADEQRRPLLIATSGYDSTIYEGYFGQAASAVRRGYHCLVFDGPGQGAVLIEQDVTIRADWEKVVNAVVDAVVDRDEVDADRIALTGWSLGGYLALRGASGEPRLAACIADPALYSMGAGAVGRLKAAGLSDEVIARWPDFDDATLKPVADAIDADRAQHWAINQRGFWVHGVNSFAEYLKSTAPFTLEGRLGAIKCPTFLGAAENDPLSRSAQQVHDELTCPKVLVEFKASEGAGDHCEGRNRPLFDQRALDWLDGVLKPG